MGSEILEAALGYARRGWPVLPCRPNQKVPATSNGLKDATTDWRRVAQWWTNTPGLNVAVCTGAEAGVVVLDVDGDEGFASLRRLELENARLPETASVVTPGGGSHYYFKHPGGEYRNSAGLLGTGLDIRGDGGYVLAPPSINGNGKRYEPDDRVPIAALPEWLLEHPSQRRGEDGSQDQGVWLSIMREGAQEGQRNHAIARIAGYLLRRYVHLDVARELVHLVNTHKFSPPLAAWEIDRTIDSILDREMRRRNEEAPDAG